MVGTAPTDCAPSARTGTPVSAAELGEREHRTGRPEHLRRRDQPRPGRDGGEDRVGVGRRRRRPRAGRAERPEEPEVLVGRRDDLVAGPELEPAEHDRAALRRRARQRHLVGLGADEGRERAAELVAQLHRLLEVRQAAAALGEIALDPRRQRVGDRPRERAERPGVEVCDPLEHGEERACLLERHARDLEDAVDGRVVGEDDAVLHPARHAAMAVTSRTPRLGRARRRCPRPRRVAAEPRVGDVEVPGQDDGSPGRGAGPRRTTRARSTSSRGTDGSLKSFDAWRFPTTTPGAVDDPTACTRRRSRPASLICSWPGRSPRVRRDEHRVRLAGEPRAEEALVGPRDPGRERPETERRPRHRAEAPHARPASSRGSAQTGSSCRQSTSGRSAVASSIMRRRNPARRGGWAFPWKTFQVRTSSRIGAEATGSVGRSAPMHVVLADPPAFTPPYDHELAAALARAGATVELVTSPFRFGERPRPTATSSRSPSTRARAGSSAGRRGSR